MVAAQALDLAPVRGLGRVDAAGADHRLADERRDLVALSLEQRAERLGVVDPDVDHLVDEGAAVAGLVARDAGERRAPGVHPVVAVLARDDDPLLRSPDRVPVAPGELGGRVDGVGAARTQEDHRVVHRGEARESLGQRDRRFGRVRAER